MQVHRSRHASGFTVLPNSLLQDRRLSYTAKGLLVDLLSRPDGWSEDGRRMADTSPQGRLAVARALRELTALAYYRVDRVRRDDGTLVSESHVFDTPQREPGVIRPSSGGPTTDAPGGNPIKNPDREPTLPEPVIEAEVEVEVGAEHVEAVDTLFRVVRAEPRLRLGTAEAKALAPLVGAWLARGFGERELTVALLSGLPEPVHSAPALLRDRLVRKLPPAPPPERATRRWVECDECGRPTPQAGICRACAGLGDRSAEYVQRADAAIRGLAKVRAALRGTSPGGVALGVARS
ncbi:hypothetical protein [Streptomyces hainanensis]|uniref:Helix-turn-helix domain-containing protein n=1 Tax=Streptomyces hainanensis TaxID=402648 RepID=A0A4R4TTR2_9ACTN|nr:hypothetical protein [Streptomyces hainanensis]TDC80196.1 hypothetical protein E1283_01005 [Streptomyces hainanensis]